MNWKEVLRKKNRTLLEMHIGMLFFGLLCQVAGVLCTLAGLEVLQAQWGYSLSLWFGVVLAMLSAIHMYRTLDRSLDQGEAAVKLIFKGYGIRYVLIVLIMLIIITTKIMNPRVVFLGYMSLKVTALMQPITHKLTNYYFQETDPEPEPMPIEEEGDPEESKSVEKKEVGSVS